jgi:hypothetical protein
MAARQHVRERSGVAASAERGIGGGAAARVAAGVDLYWLPLGAGGHSVRFNGKVFEAAVALLQRRRPLDLYHAALLVHAPEGTYAIESTPVPDADAEARGVVAGGPVGSRRAGRLRIFRYEVRCWLGGVVPDLAEAVESPQQLAGDEEAARRVLRLAPHVPAPVWGRDELEAGEMWNSNSVVSWLLERSGVGAASATMPHDGRAPGWDAGVAVARRAGPPGPAARRHSKVLPDSVTDSPRAMRKNSASVVAPVTNTLSRNAEPPDDPRTVMFEPGARTVLRSATVPGASST